MISNPSVENYRLQIRLNTVIKFDQEVGNVTEKKIPSSGLQYNNTYKWRVKAENNLGWGPWSSYEYFKTPQTPYAPTIIYPKGGTTTPTTVTLQWQAVNVTPAVDKYHVQVYRASDNKLLRDREVTNTNTTVTLPGQTTYKWHVRAHNSKAWGPWCDYKRFNTN